MARLLSVLTFVVAVVLLGSAGSAYADSWHKRGNMYGQKNENKGKKSRVIKQKRAKVPELSASGALAALSLVGGAAAVAHGRRRKRA